MFERYIEKSRRVIFFSRWEANQFGSPTIDPEHILLALLREPPEILNEFLSEDQTASLRPAIEQAKPPGDKQYPTRDLPLSDGSKRVLAYAARESQSLGYGYICPHHLLLGVLCESDSLANRLLTERNVKLQDVRQNLQRARPQYNHPFKRRLLRWLPAIHILLSAALVLLLAQVFGIALEHRFYHSDAVFYGISLPAVTAGVLMLTWVMRIRAQMSWQKMMRYMIGVPIVVLPAYFLIIHALLSPTPE